MFLKIDDEYTVNINAIALLRYRVLEEGASSLMMSLTDGREVTATFTDNSAEELEDILHRALNESVMHNGSAEVRYSTQIAFLLKTAIVKVLPP